ncbi:MAG: thiol peroxidase [Flavobacteriales bacterium]
MATITHRGNAATTAGELPHRGALAPTFRLTGTDLKDIRLEDLKGKNVVLNIFPSIDTSTCAQSVRRFNELAASLKNTVVLCVSKDLPYAHRRFCAVEGIENVRCAAQYKDTSFSDAYQVDITAGSTLVGLMSRAIMVIDERGTVRYTEQVADISSEPDYERALSALKS